MGMCYVQAVVLLMLVLVTRLQCRADSVASVCGLVSQADRVQDCG